MFYLWLCYYLRSSSSCFSICSTCFSFFLISSSNFSFKSLYPKFRSYNLCSSFFRLLIALSYSSSSFLSDCTCEANAAFWFLRSPTSITCFPSSMLRASVTAFSIWTPTPWRIISFSVTIFLSYFRAWSCN